MPATSLPGQPGNCYIFGHSSDLFWRQGKYKTIFALLPQIKIGEKIVISNSQGEKFIYQVLDSFSANVTEQICYRPPGKQSSILILQTSWPLGTVLKRWIVIAKLTPP